MKPCCANSRQNYSEPKKAGSNVRYKYVTVPPLTKGIKLDIISLNSPYGPVWYSHDVTLTIKKKGCVDDCYSALTYTAATISDNNISFVFDEEFLSLCRGRYEGIVCIGCETLNCRIDFHVGQYLCIGKASPEQKLAQDGVTPITDALDIVNPNCCLKCEKEKPCGCFDATKQDTMCGNSLSCDPIKLETNYNLAIAKIDELDAWLAEKNGDC